MWLTFLVWPKYCAVKNKLFKDNVAPVIDSTLQEMMLVACLAHQSMLLVRRRHTQILRWSRLAMEVQYDKLHN